MQAEQGQPCGVLGKGGTEIVSTCLDIGRGLEMGAPIHSLVIPGECHFLETDALKMWILDC